DGWPCWHAGSIGETGVARPSEPRRTCGPAESLDPDTVIFESRRCHEGWEPQIMFAMARTQGGRSNRLWKCPDCGAKLVSRNLSHSCGDYSVQDFLAGTSEIGRSLFERFVALVAACGPYDVAPAKTRVAFMRRVRFASVNRVGKNSIDVHFVLPRAVNSDRFRRIEHLGPLHVHHLRLMRAEDFDIELAAWLRSSYVEYGERRWLRPQ